MSIEQRSDYALRSTMQALFKKYVALCAVAVLIIVRSRLPLKSEAASKTTPQHVPSDRDFVIVLDVNARQKKVLPLELELGIAIVRKLDQHGNVFSLITFGSSLPVLLASDVSADQFMRTIQSARLEQPEEKYSSVRLHEALDLALHEFRDDGPPGSVLVISEGDDYFPGKSFNEVLSRARQLSVTLDVALVADHPLYGAKGLQRYGFDLRRLAGKTHGQYAEIGGSQTKALRSADLISIAVLHH